MVPYIHIDEYGSFVTPSLMNSTTVYYYRCRIDCLLPLYDSGNFLYLYLSHMQDQLQYYSEGSPAWNGLEMCSKQKKMKNVDRIIGTIHQMYFYIKYFFKSLNIERGKCA